MWYRFKFQNAINRSFLYFSYSINEPLNATDAFVPSFTVTAGNHDAVILAWSSCGEKASVDAGLSLQLARILAYGIGHAGLGHGVI